MHAAKSLAFAAVLWIGLAGTAYSIELIVSVTAERPPDQVTVNLEGDSQLITLSRDHADGAFKTTLSGPKPGTSQLVVSYRLVAYWNSTTEQLYLGIKPLHTRQLNIYVYHEYVGSDDIALRRIESLDSDFVSLLRKYFWSRTFHTRCRNEYNLPNHSSAVRSAKLWYDATVNLSKLPESVFRMDEDIKKIMQDYEDLATRDKSFAKCYRRYVREGYIRGTNRQVVALNYAFVGKIPAMVAEGRLDEAGKLNERALKAFYSESRETQRTIRIQQGINQKLLRDNAQYIDTLRSLRR